jgi:hypothetical protein
MLRAPCSPSKLVSTTDLCCLLVKRQVAPRPGLPGAVSSWRMRDIGPEVDGLRRSGKGSCAPCVVLSDMPRHPGTPQTLRCDWLCSPVRGGYRASGVDAGPCVRGGYRADGRVHPGAGDTYSGGLDSETACLGSTLSGHRRDSMSSDVLQWSSARPGTPPAGPGRGELLPSQSLVTVHASAPATDPRVATASRRKVVGVDCV